MSHSSSGLSVVWRVLINATLWHIFSVLGYVIHFKKITFFLSHRKVADLKEKQEIEIEKLEIQREIEQEKLEKENK